MLRSDFHSFWGLGCVQACGNGEIVRKKTLNGFITIPVRSDHIKPLFGGKLPLAF
ncbi:hypothetical protein RAS2_23900 [Phycisphaerae bacterium RAS2]|nr:hypothetical protein RAS2_23900 [Phycisphaerae bacterium RAS2]